DVEPVADAAEGGGHGVSWAGRQLEIGGQEVSRPGWHHGQGRLRADKFAGAGGDGAVAAAGEDDLGAGLYGLPGLASAGILASGFQPQGLRPSGAGERGP